jgi:hypothetical protein
MNSFSTAMALSMVYIILMISNGIQRVRLPYRDNIIGTSNTHKHLIIVITEQDQLSVTHAPHQIQSSIFSPNVANYWAKMSPCNTLYNLWISCTYSRNHHSAHNIVSSTEIILFHLSYHYYTISITLIL